MIRLALLLAAGFGLLHLAGGRAEVGILSGTLAGGEIDGLLGLAYVIGWFGFVLIAPILVIAAAISALPRLVARCGNIGRRTATWIDSGRP